jgi:cadmium resistance protein CadD (predicted permease)
MVFSATSVGTAIVVFVSTNTDDLVILAALFGGALRPRSIVAGQFIGIGALTAISAIAAYASLAVPPGWTALLGAIPLGLGLTAAARLWRDRGRATDDDHEAATKRRLEARRGSQVLAVTAITVANGGDNLGIYIPLFASDISVVPLFTAIFALLTALWCVLGYALVNNPPGRAFVQRFGHILLPVVLIAVGAYILWGARVLLT